MATYLQWLAEYAPNGVSVTPSTEGRFTFLIRGQHGDWTTDYGSLKGEPPKVTDVLDWTCGDFASIEAGFANWEHGFDSITEAHVAFNKIVESRRLAAHAFGQTGLNALLEATE